MYMIKMLNTTNHQRNENQNHSGINVTHQSWWLVSKKNQRLVLARLRRSWNTCILLVGIQNGEARQKTVQSRSSRWSLSHVQLFATQWTVTCQAPLSMGFSRQEYWSGLPFPSPEDFPNPGIEPGSPALQADSLPFEPQGSPKNVQKFQKYTRTHTHTQTYIWGFPGGTSGKEPTYQCRWRKTYGSILGSGTFIYLSTIWSPNSTAGYLFKKMRIKISDLEETLAHP